MEGLEIKEPKRYLITAALPYANGPLHLGHIAGSNLAPDIYTRALRLCGKEAIYICGSDEHGAAITIKAQKEGSTPKEVIDKYNQMFVDAFEGLGIKFDYYGRTSDPEHHKTAQDVFRNLYDKGAFLEKTTEQYFDEETQQFLADRYIKGECPICHEQDAYGDQCEKCGSTLSPTELINPKSAMTGNTPVMKKTSHWFLPLDKYEDDLRAFLEEGKLDGVQHHDPKKWKKHVIGQCKSWLDGGLLPRAMTRDLSWGIDVPQDIPGAEGKKLYVWMDAPIGYITFTKQWAEREGKDWKDYWQNDETALVHFIGKDNIVFHCLIFPAILKAHGDFILPTNVPANQFLNLEGAKLSTSKHWAVWLHEYLEDFPARQDELRYNLIKNMPESRDSEFTWKGFQETTNNELVNNLANFVNRVVVLTNKYYDGVVPEMDDTLMFVGSDEEETIIEAELVVLYDALFALTEAIKAYNFREALRILMDISSKGNQILQFNEPWKLIKSDPDTVQLVMFVALQYVSALSIACRPFMPFTSDKMAAMLNAPKIEEKGELLTMMSDLSEGRFLIKSGHKINTPSHLFTRITDDVIEQQLVKLQEAAKANAVVTYDDVKEETSFDDFTKMDIRTGRILSAEKVRKTKKLLKIKVDLGFEERTVVSGIAEFYKPEDIIGQEVLLLANLAPRKLKGIESQGMILMAEDSEGKLSFVAPEKGWPTGMGVR